MDGSDCVDDADLAIAENVVLIREAIDLIVCDSERKALASKISEE